MTPEIVPPPVLPVCLHCGANAVDSISGVCRACGRSAVTPPGLYQPARMPQRPVAPRKPLIDPLWQREWLKGSAGAVLFFGVFGFLGGTVLLPLSVQKPVDMGVIGMVAAIAWVIQAFTGLGVIAEWPINKKIYVSILGTLLVSSMIFGFGDLYNVAAFGGVGGLMLAIRALSTMSVITSLVVAGSLKQIPLD